MKIHNKKIFSLTALTLFLIISPLHSFAAKDFIVENKTSALFIINGTTGNIILTPSFGLVGIGTINPINALTVIGSVSTFGSLNATFINATEIRIGTNLIPTNGAFNNGNYTSLEDSAFRIVNFTTQLNNYIPSFFNNENFTNLKPFTITNYSAEYASTGFKIINFTTNYENQAYFKIANYTALENAAFTNTNYSNLNNSLWNLSRNLFVYLKDAAYLVRIGDINRNISNDTFAVIGSAAVYGSLNATSFNSSFILQNNNQVQTINAVFNIGNYSSEYAGSGFKITNYTALENAAFTNANYTNLEAAAFTKANYSSEYASTGFKNANYTSLEDAAFRIANFTTNYENQAYFKIANYTALQNAAFTLANYSAEYASSGYKLANFTSNLNAQNSSLWNRSVTNIYLRFIDDLIGIGTITPDNRLTIRGTDTDANLAGQPGLLHLNITDSYNKSATNLITLDHNLNNPGNSTGGIGIGILFRAINNDSELVNVSFINASLVNAINGSEASALSFYTRAANGLLTPKLILNGSDVFIGANAATGGAITVLNSGSVGIGTTSPASVLNIVTASTASVRGIISGQHNDGGQSPVFDTHKSRGTAASPTVITSGDGIGSIRSYGYDGSNYLLSGQIDVISTGTIAATRVPTYMAFLTSTDATPSVITERMRIQSDGNVGIGTTGPQNKLEVIGAVTLAGGVNASSLNVTGFSITDDSMVTLSDGSKKKIKDIRAGEEVLTLDEKTGKLVPRKVNALLDHGIKPIYEMKTEGGRSINTTAEHPYFVRGGGYIRNLNGESTNNFPLNSEGLTLSNKSDNASVTVLMTGGTILMNTIPSCSPGGNSSILPKCLSKDKITLPSAFAIADISPSSEPRGARFKSNLLSKNLLTSFGMFSSARRFNLSDGDIFFLFENLGGIVNSREDGFFRELREVVPDNTVSSYSGAEQGEDLPNHYSGAFEGEHSMADFTVSNNILIDFGSHNINNDNAVFKTFEKPDDHAVSGKWIEVRHLKIGDEIAVPDYSTGAIKWEKIASIKALEPQHVYDLSIEGTRNFIANDIVAHNTYLATSSGNVGINTTSPAHTLTVAGTLNITVPSQGGNASIFVNSTGAVSIGRANPLDILHVIAPGQASTNGPVANSYPIARFMIKTTANDGERGLQIGAPVSGIGNAPIYLKRVGTSNRFGILNDADAEQFTILDGGSIGINTTVPAQTLTIQGTLNVTPAGQNATFVITPSGNIGIGNSTPQDVMTIDLTDTGKNITFNMAGGSKFRMLNNGGGGSMRLEGSVALVLRSLTSSINFQNGSGTALAQIAGVAGQSTYFNANGVGTGLFGLNTTTPAETLDVIGTLSVKSGQAGNAQGLYQNSAGSVGIGTTGPASILHINSSNPTLRLQNTGSGDVAIVGYTSSGTPLWNITGNTGSGLVSFGQVGGGDVALIAGNAEVIRLKSTGNVGIGTTVPGTKLTVAGDANISGSLNVSSGLNVISGNVGIGTTDAVATLTLKRQGRLQWLTGNVNANSRSWAIDNDILADGDFHIMSSDANDNTIDRRVMSFDKDGNVGIGTTGPSHPLHVRSATDPTIAIDSGGANTLARALRFMNQAGNTAGYLQVIPNTIGTDSIMQFYVGGGAAGDLKMVIDDNGNVGIGTTGPGEELEIKSATPELRFNDSDNPNFFDIGMSGTDFKIFSNDTSASGILIDQSGNVGIGTTSPNYLLQVASGTDGRSVNLSNVLYVNGTNGSVGIGTTSPGGQFEVYGNPAAATTRGDFLVDTANKTVYVGRLSGTSGDNTNFMVRDRQGNSRIEYNVGTGNVYLQAVNSNVGIGTTGPARLLHVNGSQDGTVAIRLENTKNTSSAAAIIEVVTPDSKGLLAVYPSNYTGVTAWANRTNLIADTQSTGVNLVSRATAGDIRFLTGGDSNERMKIDSSGNVGIGTTSPGTLLDINGLESVTARYSGTDANGVRWYLRKTRGTAASPTIVSSDDQIANIRFSGYDGASQITAASIQSAVDATPGTNDMPGRLMFLTTTDGAADASEKMRITNAGNVGIGTASPTRALHVIGDINISDDLFVTDHIYLGKANTDGSTAEWGTEYNIISLDGASFIAHKDNVTEITQSALEDTTSDNRWEYALGDNGRPARISLNSTNGSITFYTTDTPGPHGNPVTWTTGLHQSRSGNVGIGTTGPLTPLNIQKSLAGTYPTLGTTAGHLLISSGGLWGMFFGLDASSGNGWIQQMRNDAATAYNLILNPVGGNVGIGTTAPTAKLHINGSGGALLNISNATTAMLYVDGVSGSVGIGTASPASLLHLKKDGNGGRGAVMALQTTSALINDETQIAFLNDGGAAVAGTSSARIRSIYNNTGNGASTLQFDTWDGSAEATRIMINGAGNVGIGTKGPLAKLHVSSGASGMTSANADADELVVESAGTGGISIITPSTGSPSIFLGRATAVNVGRIVYNHTDDRMDFHAGSARIMTLDDSGNVGIGNTIPNVTLSVSGNANVSGRLSYGTLAANSPHFLESIGEPEPLCIKASTGKYVGCMVDDNFEFSCKIDERCNRKFLDAKLGEEIEKLSNEAKQSVPISNNGSIPITGNTALDNKNSKSSAERLQRINDVRNNVKEKKISIKDAIASLAGEELKTMDINEIRDESQETSDSKLKKGIDTKAIGAEQWAYITKINGSVIIRLG